MLLLLFLLYAVATATGANTGDNPIGLQMHAGASMELSARLQVPVVLNLLLLKHIILNTFAQIGWTAHSTNEHEQLKQLKQHQQS